METYQKGSELVRMHRKVTYRVVVHNKMGDDIFKSERSKGSASDVDNDGLIGRGKTIQKNTYLVKIRNKIVGLVVKIEGDVIDRETESFSSA